MKKVEGIPVEAWGVHCAHCGRHDEMLGSLSYVKGLFIRYGWEFRHTYSGTLDKGVSQGPDRVYCKACKLKVKEIPMDASKLNMSPGDIIRIDILDFASLLRRYISLIQGCEGTDFMDHMDLYHFTQDEMNWMQQVGMEEWAKIEACRKQT